MAKNNGYNSSRSSTNNSSSNSRSSSSSTNSSSSNSRSSSSALKAQQEAQRAQEAAKKARIQNQINTKNNEISQLGGIVSELQSEKTDLTNSIQKWVNGKDAFGKESITAGEVKNIFEGEAAKSVKQQNDLEILLMDGKMASAAAIKDAITGQENRIKTKITTLSAEVVSLRSQL